MLTEKEILLTLDDSNKGSYNSFMELGHVYSYLIDCRLNVFRAKNERWAIAIERLGYNPRAGAILLDIYYFGNCLINLESYNGEETNYYTVMPLDHEIFNETIDGEVLRPDAEYWIVRGSEINLSHDKQDYLNAGIELKEYEPGQISVEEAGRLLAQKYPGLFRANVRELYKSIPSDLDKILVLDEWFHKDFIELEAPEINDEQLRYVYEFNKNLPGNESFMDYESFQTIFKRTEQEKHAHNQQEWQDNRPGSYETWQQLAQVIASGDLSLYKPGLSPNTHWKHWPESGSL